MCDNFILELYIENYLGCFENLHASNPFILDHPVNCLETCISFAQYFGVSMIHGSVEVCHNSSILRYLCIIYLL